MYVHLWRRTASGSRPACASYQMIADGTGLSKGSVQAAVRSLEQRQLVGIERASRTAAPVFTLSCHWRAR